MAEKVERASGNGGRTGESDVNQEIAAIKSDLARLSDHVSGLIAAAGSEASRTARTGVRRMQRNVDRAIEDAGELGHEALDAARDTRDEVADAVEDAIHRRPFTTIALAVGAGFLIGAASRK